MEKLTAFEVLNGEEYGRDATLAVLRGVRPCDLIRAWEVFNSDFGGDQPLNNFATAHNILEEYAQDVLDAGRELSEAPMYGCQYEATRKFARKWGFYHADPYEDWSE